LAVRGEIRDIVGMCQFNGYSCVQSTRQLDTTKVFYLTIQISHLGLKINYTYHPGYFSITKVLKIGLIK
jgi:hypothetical protein